MPGGRGRPRRACGICKPSKKWNRNGRGRYSPTETARRDAAAEATRETKERRSES
jgi:hypothetical protein